MPFHIRLGSIKKLTLEKREFFYRAPEIGIRKQKTELRREGVTETGKNGRKGNRRNDKPKLFRFTDQPLDPVEDHLWFYAPDTAVIAVFTGFLSIYGARPAGEIGLQDAFLSEPVTQKAEPGMGRSPYRHGGRSHERSQMHHQRIHRHHAIQVGNEVHLVPQLYLAVQCCEHLNRSLVVEAATAERYNLEEVTVRPVAHAGGAMATAAYENFAEPVVVEKISAHLGIDIGQTLIGMHLKRVAVPVRLQYKKIGEAVLTAAKTRPPLVGGPRAQYLENRP